MKKSMLSILLAAFFLWAGPSASPGWSADDRLEDALQEPLETVKGEKFRLADFHGQIVILNFWATWCPPCLDEIPELVRFQDEYAHRGIKIIGVNFLERANVKRLTSFIEKTGINYPIVSGSREKMQRIALGVGGVLGLPVTKFLDRQGRVVRTHMGSVSGEQLRGYLDKILLK